MLFSLIKSLKNPQLATSFFILQLETFSYVLYFNPKPVTCNPKLVYLLFPPKYNIIFLSSHPEH